MLVKLTTLTGERLILVLKGYLQILGTLAVLNRVLSIGSLLVTLDCHVRRMFSERVKVASNHHFL